MRSIADYLWLIPTAPLLAAGVAALLRQRRRAVAAGLAIGAMGLALVLSLWAFGATLGAAGHGVVAHDTRAWAWLTIGGEVLRLGWVLDPLTAVMLVMVSLVGVLIFIYSTGYMADDENFTRFFCFLALFAAAMLGLVIANSLLLLFICWELVGLASYLLIGFWYRKPSAAAAAQKAFITTRIGDLGLLLGMVWLYHQSGTLLFYDDGRGCLESSALTRLAAETTLAGMGVSTAISLLIFCGAVGKSGQVPLHVWLPDAMEGPTPVSALIHAATMVAAGVFLMARVYPLIGAHPDATPPETIALQVVTWIGALTAVFAASIAVAQNDLKRILAYSTVSQLGFMMLGLGTGGVAVGMFHLITHAFFKALLFLGAGSIIHGCHDEQDIRRMGGLRRAMPVTFATYAVGMLALAGFPLLFSGFWSKDEILHAAHAWPVSRIPLYLGLVGAVLTAFYMTRQVCHVFFGEHRGGGLGTAHAHASETASHEPSPVRAGGYRSTCDPERTAWPARLVRLLAALRASPPGVEGPHESPPVMTVPLAVLAAFAVLLGFFGTPVWPWFQSYLTGEELVFHAAAVFEWDHLSLLLGSGCLALGGIALGWWLYGRRPLRSAAEPDALGLRWPGLFRILAGKYFLDEFFEATVVRAHAAWARFCDALDRWLWSGVVLAFQGVALGLSWVSKFLDEFGINAGFDLACRQLRRAAGTTTTLQDGRLHNSLRALALALALFLLLLTWGVKG